jgi:hypothetical protein
MLEPEATTRVLKYCRLCHAHTKLGSPAYPVRDAALDRAITAAAEYSGNGFPSSAELLDRCGDCNFLKPAMAEMLLTRRDR